MPSSKGKILVIDDKPSIREFMGEILEAEGYFVFMAKNGDEGLEMIKKNDFNLVFLDLRFPDGIDGIQVLEQALRAKPKLQIVIISAYGEIKDAVEATRLGAYDFIEKDHLDQERLLVTARRALEKESIYWVR